MPCGNRYVDETRARRHRGHRNQPVDPQGYTGTEPYAESMATEKARKGANWAPVWATVWSSGTQMAGRPSHGRQNAHRAQKSMPLGPEGGVRHSSELARTARREKIFRGETHASRRAASDIPLETEVSEGGLVHDDDGCGRTTVLYVNPAGTPAACCS